MAKLTTKQEKFINYWIATGNKTKAYKSAYSTSNMLEKTINEKASSLSNQDKIKARYNELMKKHKKKALYTRENLLNDLKKALKIALGEEDTKRLIASQDSLGELTGKTIQGKEVSSKDIKGIAEIIIKLENWDKEEVKWKKNPKIEQFKELILFLKKEKGVVETRFLKNIKEIKKQIESRRNKEFLVSSLKESLDLETFEEIVEELEEYYEIEELEKYLPLENLRKEINQIYLKELKELEEIPTKYKIDSKKEVIKNIEIAELYGAMYLRIETEKNEYITPFKIFAMFEIDSKLEQKKSKTSIKFFYEESEEIKDSCRVCIEYNNIKVPSKLLIEPRAY